MSASRSIGTRDFETRLATPVVIRRSSWKPSSRSSAVGDVLQGEAELHHAHGYVRLNPDDHGARPAKLGGIRDPSNGSRGERVEDIERRDIEDHSTAAKSAQPDP